MTDFKEFVSVLEPDKKAIVRALRGVAQGVSTDIVEGIKWNALCFFKGDRPFVGIMPYKNYVSVIFDRGSEMTDELGVLEGSGNRCATSRYTRWKRLNKRKWCSTSAIHTQFQEGDRKHEYKFNFCMHCH